jgi:hypothetical protein
VRISRICVFLFKFYGVFGALEFTDLDRNNTIIWMYDVLPWPNNFILIDTFNINSIDRSKVNIIYSMFKYIYSIEYNDYTQWQCWYNSTVIYCTCNYMYSQKM